MPFHDECLEHNYLLAFYEFQGYSSHSPWILVLIPVVVFFPIALFVASCRVGMHGIQPKPQGKALTYIQIFFSASMPHLQYFTLKCLDILVTAHSDLILTRQHILYAATVRTHMLWFSKCLQAESQDNHEAYLIQHPYLTDHGPELSSVKHLKPFILCFFLQLFVYDEMSSLVVITIP